MDKWLCKLVAFFIMLVVMLTVSLVPFRVVTVVRSHGRRGQSIVLTLTCFTGGIFLGTCLLFLIPEVSFLIDSALRSFSSTSSVLRYPFGELIIGAGFFLVMFIERAVVELQNQSISHEQLNGKLHSPESSAESSTSSVSTSVEDSVKVKCCDEAATLVLSNEHVRTSDSVLQNMRIRKDSICSCDGIHEDRKKLGNPSGSRRSLTQGSISPADEVPVASDCPAAVVLAVTASSVDDYSAAKTIVFFVALSLDCFLGGLSMGLQRSATAVWTVLVGVLAHEAVVGFGLGLQLADRATIVNNNRHQPTSAITMATVYACVGPIGIAVGTFVADLCGSGGDSAGLTLITGILQGVATGVFLYVTFFELLEGKVSGRSRGGDLIAILIGFAVMAAIAAVPQQDEEVSFAGAMHSNESSSVNISLSLI